MHAIVCLGNPGPEYVHNRHNVGFLVADYLAENHGVQLNRRRLRSLFGRGSIADHDVLIVKPQTFMNDSGDAVWRISRFFRIPPSQLLLVHDEIALDLGVLRLRRGGSDAGHKGVRSVISVLGTREVPRLRIGIGAPPEGMNARDWVLSDFKPSERSQVEDMVARAAEAAVVWMVHGIEAAMNQFNA